MNSRNVVARIIKLEARRQRPDETLLVWRRPDADVKAAASVATFAPGDRVICLEWFGTGKLPAPRWCRKGLSSELSATENEYVTRSLERACEPGPARAGFAGIPVSSDWLRDASDTDLLHMVFGVAA